MDGKVEVLDQDEANLAELVGLGEVKDVSKKDSKVPITIEKVDSEAAPATAVSASPDNEEPKEEDKIIKTSFISANEETSSKNESDGIGEIAIVDIAAGEIKLPGGKTGAVDNQEYKLIDNWTFWYVYSMSHRDKKKIKQVRKNEYELREVYSFETVSQNFAPNSLHVDP